MTRSTLIRALPALGALVFLAGCAEVETRPTAVAPTPPLPYAWNGDGVPGPAKIIVDIRQQRAYFFKGKAMVGETTVSTGKPGFSTPPGSYKVVWKDKDHISTRFGDYVDDYGNVVKSNIDSAKDPRPKGSHYDGARMPYAMFFRGGYAMHQGYVPPYAASHGCIRLPQGIAEIFFNAVELGTPVIVKESSSESSSLVGPQTIPSPDTVPPPAPNIVRFPAPAPAPVRPAPTPVRVTSTTAVRSPSPAPLVSRVPATVRPAPTPVRFTPQAPVRSPSPAPVVSRVPTTVRPGPTPVRLNTPAPVRSPSPAPIVSRAPASVRPGTTPVPLNTPAPVRSPSPAPVVSRVPTTVRAPAPPSVRPTPTPVQSRTSGRVRSPGPATVISTAPTPTPSPTPAHTKRRRAHKKTSQ